MNRKIFIPEKYGMVICPNCNSYGYIQTPERQCCPKCGGFGFIKNEKEASRETGEVGKIRGSLRTS
jgi:ssDNA-binding Zn-finger/Zn-ribbon topoisomerase 1